MAEVVGRLAPSPSGEMHLGNAFSALLAWLSARSQGGRVLLRLEDLDKPRCPAAYAHGVMEDFRWLGLDWDNEPVWQSRRDEWYEECLGRLAARGLLYPCFCTRRQLHATPVPAPTEASAPHGKSPVYAGTCRALTSAQQAQRRAEGRKEAVRVRVPDEVWSFSDGHFGPYAENLAESCGDFILRRSDGLYAYQLAVVADDGAMGVNEIVRGRDLLPATPQQLWLQEMLGFPHPHYAHVPLLVAPDGRRLSKREGDLSLKQLSKRMSPKELVGKLAVSAGILDHFAPISPEELIDEFDWERVKREDIVIGT